VACCAYTLPESGAKQALDAPIRGRFSKVDDEVKAARDLKVTEAVLEQMTRERTQRAIALQDQGKIKEARDLMMQNATEINALAATIPLSQHMRDLQTQYYALGAQAAPATGDHLLAGRKAMRALQAPAASAGVRY
jgi:hypothetical protein